MNQTQLRKTLRAQRRALSAAQQRQASQRLCQHLLALPALRRARRIASYMPNDGEIDPTPLIATLWRHGKACYLPVISHLPWERLRFARLLPDTRLLQNRFGIPEPDSPRRDCKRAQSMDIILMPLVAFDTHGNRLGMGGGFYDHTLAFLRQRRHWRRPHLIGLAHSLQQVATIPSNPWDVPLHGIVTDQDVLLLQN